MVRDAMVVPFESVCLWLIEGADIVRTFDVCLQLICFCFFFVIHILDVSETASDAFAVTMDYNDSVSSHNQGQCRNGDGWLREFSSKDQTKFNFFCFLLQSKKKNVWVQLEWPRPTDVSMWHRNKICPCAKNVIVIRPLFLSQVSIYGAYMVFQLEPVNRVHLLSSFIDIN